MEGGWRWREGNKGRQAEREGGREGRARKSTYKERISIRKGGG